MPSAHAFILIFFAIAAIMPAFTAYGAQSAAPSEPRTALIIGNSGYRHEPLKNPANDAEDMAKMLRSLGFEVTLKKDASFRQMVEAINDFGRALKKGGVGLFYFAGHGVQSKGRNYLVPVNANVESEADLEFEAVDANRMLAAMDDAGNRVNIMILDACRNNPFTRSFRSASRGLAQMDAAKGTYIAFATSPGSVAADGSGRNGVYTEHLLKSLQAGDTDIHRVFTRVTADVSRATSGKQVPWSASSLTGDFAFHAQADERVLWDSVKSTQNPAELEAYLTQFPNGLFANVARARLRSLTTSAQVATIAPSPPAAPVRDETAAPPLLMTYANEDKDYGVPPTATPRPGKYHAPTPLEIPGGKVIRTVDLKRLLDNRKDAVIVDVLDSKDKRATIPGATWLNGAGSGQLFGAEKARLGATLEKLTGGDKARLLIFLCLNSECWLSYNAALHAIEAGYTNVHWFRGGTDAWRGAGHPTRSLTATNW
jgi:PQQ-dependent catabolism-associated CXXCW motif protein